METMLEESIKMKGSVTYDLKKGHLMLGKIFEKKGDYKDIGLALEYYNTYPRLVDPKLVIRLESDEHVDILISFTRRPHRVVTHVLVC